MGATRRPWQAWVLLVAGLTVAATATLTGCRHNDGDDPNPITIGVTTDKVVTKALEKGGIKVAWLTCTAHLKHGYTAGSSATPDSDSTVDCRGKTSSGNRDIKVSGDVTSVREDKCVRGDVIATVDGHRAFRATVIGEC